MFFYCIIILWVTLDLASKYWSHFFVNEKIPLVWDFLYLQYIKNDGIAFSIQLPFLKIVTIVLILGLFAYYFTQERYKKSQLVDLSFALILAGGIGNGVERVLLSEVTDFIAVSWFAIFNIADVLISLWAIIYIYYLYKTWAWNQTK